MRHSLALPAAALVILSGVALPAAAQEADWTRFRGPNGSGAAEVRGLPVEFGPQEAVVWRRPVPAGKSSPVLGDRHVFVTAAEDGDLVVLAFDRVTGEPAWRYATAAAFAVEMYPANDGASPTPTTDGENVFALFGTLGVVAIDARGEEMWRLPIEPIDNFYGQSASPVLAGDTLIILVDQRQGSYALGLDRLTGQVRWRRERLGRVESWTTPVVYPTEGGPDQILVAGSTWLDSYAADTGEPFWEMDGFGYWPIASPAIAGNVLVAAGPDMAGTEPETFAAVVARGDEDGDGLMSRAELAGLERYAGLGEHFAFGDVDHDGAWNEAEYAAVYLAPATDDYGAVGVALPAPGEDTVARVLWREQRAVPYHATPIVSEGLVYLITDSGIVSVLSAESGELVRRDRLARSGVNLSASPVLGDGKLFIASQDGEVYVVSAGPEWEVLAVNDLGEPMYATPALAPGRLFVRTDGHLYAFGAESSDE